MPNLYMYSGPVEEFGRCIDSKWSAETVASSEKKARSNLVFRYKMETGRAPYSKISLPGKITEQ